MNARSLWSRRRLLGASAASLALAALPSGVAFASPAVTPTSPPFVVKAWGTPGTGDGQFRGLFGLARDNSGNVYVADVENNRIQKFTASGTFVTTWGSGGSGTSQFALPHGVAVDGARGFVYVVDTVNCRIQKFDLGGNFLLTWGSRGTNSGQFANPTSAAIDPNGNVYVADSTNSRIQVFDPNGAVAFQFGSRGVGNGQFLQPIGPAIATLPGGTNRLYVADFNLNRVQAFDLSGNYLFQWGSKGSSNGQFDQPSSVGIDPANGFVYVVDGPTNNRIQRFDLSGNYLTQWSTLVTFGGTTVGALFFPGAIAVAPSGLLYVSDIGHARVVAFLPR